YLIHLFILIISQHTRPHSPPSFPYTTLFRSIFSETIRSDMGRYIRNDIVDKVLLRDLPALYGIRDVQELNHFFAYLAYHTGREFSPVTLCKESGLDRLQLTKYLEYLESAFLIKVLHKVDENTRHF